MTSGFLLGSVVSNVLEEELPQQRQSRSSELAIGAALYSGALLLAE